MGVIISGLIVSEIKVINKNSFKIGLVKVIKADDLTEEYKPRKIIK